MVQRTVRAAVPAGAAVMLIVLKLVSGPCSAPQSRGPKISLQIRHTTRFPCILLDMITTMIQSIDCIDSEPKFTGSFLLPVVISE